MLLVSTGIKVPNTAFTLVKCIASTGMSTSSTMKYWPSLDFIHCL